MLTKLYRDHLKRASDICVSFLLLVACSPLLLATACLVRFFLGGPVLFKQRRLGLEGKPFWIYKFRTMSDTRGKDGNLLPDRERLSRFGKLLRASSLDELPELWNVLIGDMSLVGPRPLHAHYQMWYSQRQRKRHRVRPGITGLAQISGRNEVSWNRRFALDLRYVSHCGVMLDLAIILRTLLHLLRPHGVSAAGHATMPAFPARVQPLVCGTQEIGRRGVVVIGAGGHARVIVATLRAAGASVEALFDDRRELWGKQLDGVPIYGPIMKLRTAKNLQALIAIGDSAIRKTMANELSMSWISAIHPQAYVHDSVRIDPGTVIFAGAVLQPGVRVGEHTIINTSVSIDHGSRVDSFAHLAPGVRIAGDAFVGSNAFLGLGASVGPRARVGSDAVIGAGAVVLDEVPEGCTAVGVPARVVKSSSTKTAA